MTKVDQFESMFRAAAREPYRYQPVELDSVLVVTDLDEAGSEAFTNQVRGFLRVLQTEPRRLADSSADRPEDSSQTDVPTAATVWQSVTGHEFRDAGELLKRVESADPSLICTYRNLHSTAWQWPYSLGTHLDLLTQHTQIPVLVLPHPAAKRSAKHALQDTDRVMAITDRLAGDQRLVNVAVRFTAKGGTLWLTHIEDKATFDHYMDVISRIPSLDTDEVRETLAEQLLKEPREYIESCEEVLKARNAPLTIEKVVMFGRRLWQYQTLVNQNQVDLLVLNTKDEHQLAMHGIAYALAVELRQIPLLML